MPILSETQLRQLSKHKYSISDESVLEPYFEYYWKWLVDQIPLWVAPNVLTLGGVACHAFSTAILLYYCPQATGQAPVPAYLLAALGFFILQSLDAIDGKQARRTGSSSPLGEMVDHGSDALSLLLVSVGVCIAGQFGREPWCMLFNFVSAAFLFYCAHWQSYVSGTLKFGKFDATEMQCFAILMFLITGLCGPTLWELKAPLLGVPLRNLMEFGIAAGSIYSAYGVFILIFRGGAGKNGATVAGTSILSPGLPICVVMVTALLTAVTSNQQLLQNHQCLFVMTFGLMAVKITIKLLVAYMSRSPVEMFDVCMIGGVIQVVNNQFGSRLDEYWLLWAVTIYSSISLFFYCTAVSTEICQYLNINFFTIKSKGLVKRDGH